MLELVIFGLVAWGDILALLYLTDLVVRRWLSGRSAESSNNRRRRRYRRRNGNGHYIDLRR